MKYMGGKARIANDILPIILKDRKEDQWYVEPFCGGLNILEKVDGNRIAADNNLYLISTWKGLQLNKERPHNIPRELYVKARTEYNNKTNIEFDNFTIGWIGWMASYNGRFFDGGYSGHEVGKTKRDYISEQIRGTEKQIDKIKNVKFIHSDYKDLEIPPNSIIYCDIPYKGTKHYSTSKNFNHDEFWEWCRNKNKEGHTIFISEYEAPEDFKCVWEKVITNSMGRTNTYKPTEKLFTLI
jgi:DNA adenine methylase